MMPHRVVGFRLLARRWRRHGISGSGISCRTNELRPIHTGAQSARVEPPPLPSKEDGDGKDSMHGKVPLSRRISELGLCSLDEANRILLDASYQRMHGDLSPLKRVFYFDGKPMLDGDVDVAPDEGNIEMLPGSPVRLSKRMSELGLCSRREAAAILKDASEVVNVRSLKRLKEVIYLRGKPVTEGTGAKVSPKEVSIQIRAGDDPPDEGEESGYVPYEDRPWDEIKGDTIVLNKPFGYVSGQEEHQHVPAVRLLTRANIHLDDFDEESKRSFFGRGNVLRFDRWKYSGYDMAATSVPKPIRDALPADQRKEKNSTVAETLSGYAVAGRLDMDSAGVLIFTRAGIVARKLIESMSNTRKEYIVEVRPALRPTDREREAGLTRLPRPTQDLRRLLRNGNRLLNERLPLKPLVEAEWVHDNETEQGEGRGQQNLTMRLVMVEGKKRQIRRMCRELLGWHVVKLVRTSVGPVRIDSLPEGKWRPLTKREVASIFEERPAKRSKDRSNPVKRGEEGSGKRSKSRANSVNYW
ncbi:hypothetical protein ACHAWF_016195 [Thalassiosira exigua]